MTCNLVDGKWIKKNNSQSSIPIWFKENKETDEKIIQKVRNVFGVSV